jgi:tetratricopeptide (TPR) repeat protein
VTQTGYTQGVTKPVFDSNNTLKSVEMKLSLKKPNNQHINEVEIITPLCMKQVMPLNLGHSQNQADIMYGFAGKILAKAKLTRETQEPCKCCIKCGKYHKHSSIENIDRAIASNKGRFDTKLNEALNYVKKNPHSSMSYLHLAETYVNMKDYNNAILSYRKALSYDPKNAMIYNKIGYCYEMKET